MILAFQMFQIFSCSMLIVVIISCIEVGPLFLGEDFFKLYYYCLADDFLGFVLFPILVVDFFVVTAPGFVPVYVTDEASWIGDDW